MKSRRLNAIGWMGKILLIATVTGCTLFNHTKGYETQAVDTHPIIANLAPDIERLYLSWHELDQTYKDIKFLERGFLFDPDDRQLGYVQKASLYVQDAAVRIRHRWEQLSVLHYIRPEMMRDYLTLNVKELTSAIREIGYDEKFLTIYGSFITHEAVTDDLNRARDSIKINMGVLNQILERLLPIENTTTPSTVL
ncbi:hypothetical protein [Desulfosarcina sp.]|uniref:hypothetical protein n=1 Tax=Desulfosarcina sp. TaxID=2027861 RepID=UPI0029A9293E|nr:hypothetical protein [Desulfosarcina sp.]MDX2451008.1 hypothetical protein [Desulfosarcina sp.]MDX2488835.1 hypothetical protein [Desulfosarcina sp.]